MKKFLYFIVGVIYLPIFMVTRAIRYIIDLAETLISNYNFWRRVNRNLKKTES